MKGILLLEMPKGPAVALLLLLSIVVWSSCCSISAGASSLNPLRILPLEQMAYMIPRNQNSQTAWRSKYLSMLSPGGRVYFLANRRESAKALSELGKLSKQDTGSCLYVKAFCLNGLGRHREAVQAYKQAKSRIGLVFNPGAKFFLHYSAALMDAGQLAECMKVLNHASSMTGSAESYGRRPKIMSSTIARRKIVVTEKSGKYREAIDGYLKLLLDGGVPIKLKESFSADTQAQARASLWLKKHVMPPARAKKEKVAGYLLDSANAYLTLGKFEPARGCLEKVAAAEPLVRYEIPTETERAEVGTPLGKCRAEARMMLARLYYAQKDFPKCCAQLRSMFLIDPMVDSTFWLCSISMRDVPQLVQQRDVDLHSMTVEHLLDERILEVFGPSRTEYAGPDPFKNDLFLRKARVDMEKRSFSACFNTLQSFIDTNKRLCFSPDFYKQPEKTASFMQDYAYRARLLQFAAASATGKPRLVSGFDSNLPLYKHAGWDAVEDSLRGMHRPKNTKDDRSLSNADFASLWHFAAGIREMNEGDYKVAAKEFAHACSKTSQDSDVFVYSRALLSVCRDASD